MTLAQLLALVAAAVAPPAVISWLVCWIVRIVSPRIGLLDQPAARKVHTTPTPLGGGIGIWCGVVGTLFIGQFILWSLPPAADEAAWSKFPETLQPATQLLRTHLDGLALRSGDVWAIVGLATVLAVLGLIDDRKGISWKIRLAVQAIVALAFALLGWRLTFFIDMPVLTTAVTVLWIVGLVNAFNMLDNMDGLSGGVAAIVGGMFALVTLLAPDDGAAAPQLFVAVFLLLLVGALLGFLWHNRTPAKLFMGDSGAYLIGFWIAAATVIASFSTYHSTGQKFTILAPLCILAVPLYDLITVVSIRLMRGLSPFKADRNHFSHRLVELGMTKSQAVWTIYLVAVTTGLGAVLLYDVQSWTGAGAIVALELCLCLLIGVLENAGRLAAQRRGEGPPSPSADSLPPSPPSALLHRDGPGASA